MLLYTMLYIVLAYLMLFAALTNSVCLNNASFFFLFKYFLCQGYELSGEIALKNNHYYYYYICNASFYDIGWIQATLPIRLGGIGLRRASDLSLPAYLASISASQSLISEITQPDNIPHALDSCFDVWSSTNPSLPEDPNLQLQWDDIKSSSRSVALRPLLDKH